ncbi:DUF433 domain-containing protein [Picosynechococcus sp. PCC 8807]|uniref:DUF433 domain-containing protein n=1 Tax=Picosynechococcus sp. PCC 8807 TaxID=195248 RepID=UPI0008107139|nr:DUF433 domain-containing protein [Picosynechococcus sp. PCC 8807]ANV92062.1 hypothetical protein AWQ24_14895 [Picosynechococcus sp. PCC 8807]
MAEATLTKNWNNQLYHLPIYPVVDAAHYLHIPVRTLRTWLKGGKTFLPLIKRPKGDRPELSFTNLIEAHVLQVISTEHQIPLGKVRLALDYISKEYKTPHPLTHKQFKTDGTDLFIDQIDHLINVSRSGQLAIREVLQRLLTRIEWNEADIAIRLFPYIKTSLEPLSQKILTIDPAISFGRPTITGTGVPTHIIKELYDAGDSISELAEDYSCTTAQIHAAILFESPFKLTAA